MSTIQLGSNQKNDQAKLASVAMSLNSDIRQKGNGFATRTDAQNIASFESLQPDAQQNLQLSMESHFSQLENMLRDEGIKADSTQITAGVIAAMAAQDPATYARAAITSQSVSQEGIAVVGVDAGGPAGNYGYMDRAHPAMEAFDNSNLSDFIGHSIVYNIQASKQDEFGEGFFRTVVITPDNGGVDLSIRNLLVFNHFIHGTDGTPVDAGKRRLLEACIDHKILADESTTLVPEVLVDGSNADAFVAASVVAPRDLELPNRRVRTAPLKVGKRLDLIGLSQPSKIAKNGVHDAHDTLDRMVGIKSVYMAVGGEAVKFDIKGLPRTFFVKGPEGRNREMVLHYVTRSLQLNEATKLADGSAPQQAALAEIIANKLVVNIGFSLTGDVDVELGNIQVHGTPVEVASIFNAAGEKLDLTTGTGKTIVDGLAGLSVIGYEANARLTNSNKRERGLQLDLNTYTERYPVPIGAPLTVPTPHGEQSDGGELNALITASRIINSNNAVTKLINYAETLSQFINTPSNSEESLVPQIEGIARFLVRPWFRHYDLHLPDVVNSLTSSERIADVQAALVNVLRTLSYEAIRDTNLQAVLDAYTGYTGEKFKLIIGTDSILNRYIVVPGDTRTLSDGLEFTKVVTQDQRVYGDIYFTFIREGEGLDPLNFGSHLWMPELISKLPMSRNNSHYNEAMVQPRSRHVVHLPILGRIRVTGLSDVVKDGLAITIDGQLETSGGAAPDAP